MSAEREYLIVLGAHVRGRELSLALYERVHRALEYLREHPHTKAVLSGGRGTGEEITEAQAMADYLTANGVPPDGCFWRRSTNTRENIAYSLKLIGDVHCPIGVVTNHFHIFRGCAIARKAGCTDVREFLLPIGPYGCCGIFPEKCWPVSRISSAGTFERMTLTKSVPVL